MSVVRIPERVADGPFLFSVDHAFVIRGVGPVGLAAWVWHDGLFVTFPFFCMTYSVWPPCVF